MLMNMWTFLKVMAYMNLKKLIPWYLKESEVEAVVTAAARIVLQTQQGRGWKRIHGSKSKCVISDCELGCKRKQPVQKSPFCSSTPGINSNFDITE
jgi:hypothetical protein